MSEPVRYQRSSTFTWFDATVNGPTLFWGDGATVHHGSCSLDLWGNQSVGLGSNFRNLGARIPFARGQTVAQHKAGDFFHVRGGWSERPLDVNATSRLCFREPVLDPALRGLLQRDRDVRMRRRQGATGLCRFVPPLVTT